MARRGWSWVPAGLLTLAAFPALAALLYDPTAGTTPDRQGWLPAVSGATVSITGSLLELDTRPDRATSAGYFSEDFFLGLLRHPALPLMDRAAGYILRFDLQVLFEGHDARDDNSDGKADRRGFSIVAIGEDLWGLELVFFEDRVWVYDNAGLLFFGDDTSSAEAHALIGPIDLTPVPLPAPLLLFMTGLAWLAVARRRL